MSPRRRRFVWAALAAAAAAAVIAIDMTTTTISYPLDTWRVDLDDAAIGLGTILVGIAAIWTVWLKAKEANDRTVALSHKLNGGLRQIAREHVQDNEVVIGLVHRLDKADAARDECLERFDVLQAQLDELRGTP